MQYWIFFLAGVGGDGFSNLLEHANNINPADGIIRWRIRSKPSDPKVAFYQPIFVSDDRFLRNHHCPELDLSTIYLNPNYYKLVTTRLNTVIPAHPHLYNERDNRFRYWNFLEKSQHRILLYSDNIDRVVDDFYDKNAAFLESPDADVEPREDRKNILRAGTPPYYYADDLNYNTFIDIEQVWKDWDYLNNILISIGIDLDRKFYEEYLDVSKRRPQ
jgi:hypothetical protein